LGKIKNVNISRKSSKFTLSIQTEHEVKQPYHPADTAVGIDMGVVQFATLSDGIVIAPKNSFKQLSQKLAVAQRRLSTRLSSLLNGTSRNRKSLSYTVALHRLVTTFYIKHQTSTSISKNHAMIVMEDLKVGNMSRSARGALDTPGKQVAQKSGLNRSILDQGWGEFRRQLEYKQEWLGGWLLTVPAHHASQTCSVCGHVVKENRKSQQVTSRIPLRCLRS
jgi:putative transposase